MTCGFSNRTGNGARSSEANESIGDNVPEANKSDLTPNSHSSFTMTPGTMHQKDIVGPFADVIAVAQIGKIEMKGRNQSDRATSFWSTDVLMLVPDPIQRIKRLQRSQMISAEKTPRLMKVHIRFERKRWRKYGNILLMTF
jgi:hypothetical protein